MEFNTYLKTYLDKERLEHSKKVEKLALKIADCLDIGCNTRLLSYGAMLHDIGMFQDAEAHNKIGANIIIEQGVDGLSEEETLVVACLVRYHRGSDPKISHSRFAKLNKGLQKSTAILSAILRLADGLDWKHKNFVQDIDIEFMDKKAFLTLYSNSPIITKTGFLKFFAKKKGLFEKVFDLKLSIKTV